MATNRKRDFVSIGDGLMAGVARQVGNQVLGGAFGAPLGEAAVGWFRRNDTAMYMAGRDLGGAVSQNIGGAFTELLG